MKIPTLPLALLALAVFTAVGPAVVAAPILSTSFEAENFVDPQRLDLPLKNWFEFAARHREDGGGGSGEGGASARIVDEGARSGKRALLLELSDIEKSRRSEFNVWPPDDITKEFSVSVWLRLPEDFALQAPGIDWNWMEFCVLASEEVSDKSGKRWNYLRLMLGQPDISKPEFNLSLGGRKGPQHEQYFLGRIDGFALPRGRWFNVHYCLKRDMQKGRVKVWVDGRPVFDFHDLPTTEAGGPCKISPAKLYYEPTDKMAKKVWVDDLIIWPGWVEPALRSSKNDEPVFHWEPLGLGGGGSMFAPAIGAADPDRVLVNCDMGGAYLSKDGGRSWDLIPHSELRGNTECRPAFHPTDPQTVFAAHGWSGVLRVSRDGGRTFRPIGNLPEGLSGEIRIDPDVPARMLAGAGRGAWVSFDGGERWEPCKGIEGKVLGFHFDRTSPTDKRVVYAATANGFFRSADGGARWVRAEGPLPGSPLLAFAGASSKTECALYVSVEPRVEDGAYAGGVFGSFDGGHSWQSLMRGAINRDIARRDEWADDSVARYVALLACDAAPRTLYAFNTSTGFNPPHHNAVWKTQDAGESWRATFFSDPRWPEYNVSPNWRTVNIGQNYQSAGLGWAIAPGDPDRVVFVDSMMCYGTRDGGKTWFTGNSQPAGKFAEPADSRWHHQGLVVTTTWDYLIDKHDPRTHYLCYTDIGFARSTDGGSTWNWWGEGRWPQWRNTCYAIAPDPTRKGTLWGAFSEVHDIPNGNIILGRHSSEGGGGVGVSRDFGLTWQAPANAGLPKAPVTDLVFQKGRADGKERMIAAVWEHGVYFSDDEGASWQTLGEGLGSPSNRRVSRLLALADGGLLAVVTAKRQDGRFDSDGPGLYRLEPGVQRWQAITPDGRFAWPKDVTAGDHATNKIYLGVADAGDDSGGLYATSDGGATWKRILREGPEHFGAYPDPARSGWIYATLTEGAPGCGLFLSRDGGDSFQPVNSFPFSNVQRVVFDPSNPQALYVTTFGGGAWRGTIINTLKP